MLASLAARAIPLVAHAIPTILSGFTTGLLSGGINNAISGKDVGDGLYLHKHDKFIDKQGHAKANVQKASGHAHFLEMKNTAYHCPYDLVDNQVNAIYIV